MLIAADLKPLKQECWVNVYELNGRRWYGEC